MAYKTIPYFKIIKTYNNRKGYGTSVNKAMNKAIEEELRGHEGKVIDNRIYEAFFTYVLWKSFLRFYKWVVSNIFFKHKKTKFLLYTLQIFLQGEAKVVYKEIEKELMVLALERKRKQYGIRE